MANEYLKKIILEELQKVLKEQVGGVLPMKSKRTKDPKVVELQKLLTSKGLDVGAIDGVPGPKLYRAISKIAGVPVDRLEMDFTSDPTEMADNYITVVSQPESAAPKTSTAETAGTDDQLRAATRTKPPRRAEIDLGTGRVKKEQTP